MLGQYLSQERERPGFDWDLGIYRLKMTNRSGRYHEPYRYLPKTLYSLPFLRREATNITWRINSSAKKPASPSIVLSLYRVEKNSTEMKSL